ncbi:MAG TPA: hypothetical protein VJH23_05350 [archaeon]|nr:hypothetical protein [archaeon]
MPFVELLQNAMTLNPQFFIDLVMNNLLWVFMLFAAGYFFSGGKKPLARGLVFYLMVMTSMDIFKLMGFSIFTATGIALLYFLRMPVLLLLEKTRGMGKYMSLAWTLTFYAVIAVVAFGG